MGTANCDADCEVRQSDKAELEEMELLKSNAI